MADFKEYLFTELLNEEILGLAFEIHRSIWKGTFFLDDDTTENYKLVVERGCDVFGQPLGGAKKMVECKCPNCHRSLAAVRFAPHLEKCMGMGRNSSRIASQRIANSGKLSASVSAGTSGVIEHLGVDEDLDDANDSDWSKEMSRKNKKRKTPGTNSNGSSPRTGKPAASKPSHNYNSKKLSNTPMSNSSNESVQSEAEFISSSFGLQDQSWSQSVIGSEVESLAGDDSRIAFKRKKISTKGLGSKKDKRKLNSQQDFDSS